MAGTGDAQILHDNMKVFGSERVLPLFSLDGRTAIVSGGGAGIGLAVAHALAEAGANVAIWYNSNTQAVKEAKKIKEIYGVKCIAYQVNVLTPTAVDAAVDDIVRDFDGRLDIFVANSGIAWPEGPFLDGSTETARKVMAVNVDGIMWCAKSAGKHFRRQKAEGTTLCGKPLGKFTAGSFIATASVSGSVVNAPQLQAVYNASKAAVIHFCKSLAVEWAGFARCNTVSPGYIKTNSADDESGGAKNEGKDGPRTHREGEMSELKGAYLYLASDASSFTTGLDMIVDGGNSLP